ncbi:HepT-like ribonuclease domain-containing protein [Kumtagia ephedrae]|uniref:DUF86 domain-containing protein n=1 Tax=Kumtagia ephedrae TaxID=2116701 RepID=A0A2P7RR12_9HYPH|nr:HepT-like ribonuclease domain-containing protein [Mesorhizobium ephedrae]PSJ52657.1 hypothetical protein C7I84_26075 [Mesorhizobium ephedrae]
MPFDRTSGHLQDILAQITLAEEFLGELAPEEFAADILRLYAVVRCLEIISEASRRLDENLKSRHPEIDWRAVAGAGNVYRHSYERVLAKEIWKTVKLALPTLRTAVMSEPSS